MQRDYNVYLDDILQSALRIQKFTKGYTKKRLFRDTKTVDAVIRNLLVIGEAAKHIPDSIRGKFPKVDWKSIAGIRDVLVHQYFAIDDDIIWEVVTDSLSGLVSEVRSIMGSKN